MSQLTINGVDVRISDKGLYSLNDLYKASGSEKNREPSFFLRNSGVKSFIDVVSVNSANSQCLERTVGRKGGTWCSEIIAYKYAAWINPEFDVLVFQTFEAIRASGIDVRECHNALQELKSIRQSDMPGWEKAQKAPALEKIVTDFGSSAGKSLSILRGAKTEIKSLNEEILNEIQESFEF